MKKIKEETSTITLKLSTIAELKKKGRMGDTYDDVIGRLIECQKDV